MNILYLNQQKYIRELLERCSLFNTKECDTHMTSGKGLSKIDGITMSPFEASMYKSIVGELQYCFITILDISFSINKFCQFMSQLSDVH